MCGLPKAPIVIENPLRDFIFKELNIKTVHGRRIFDTWEKLEPLLFEKKINVDPILTHVVEMNQIDQAFKLIADGSACKIQVKISTE